MKSRVLRFLAPLGTAAPAVFLATPLPNPRPISATELMARGGHGPARHRSAVPDLPRAPDPAAQPAPAGAERVVVPNADSVIDLAALASADSPGALPNPFLVRFRPAAAVREISIAVNAVLVPSNAGDACAIINGELYSPGDRFSGLTVASIDGERIDLRSDGLRLAIPVTDRPVVLRVPDDLR